MYLERLSKKLGVTKESLRLFAMSASYKYKEYRIPKRTGGFRKIEHPEKNLKSMQRLVIDEFFLDYPIHEIVKSYRKNISILDNANIHAKNNFFLRVDFENFFPSLKKEILEVIQKRRFSNNELSTDDLFFVSNILFRNGHLVIGAPSSPCISNL